MIWRNWARNQQCTPIAVDRPATEEELVAIVRRAAAAGQRVKAAGSGHSFTGAALTDGRLIALDRYSRIVSSDPGKGTVTVQAGMPLHRLNVELRARGLALENLGDIAYQTVAGAISTGTHGTGRSLGGLATQVIGLRLVAGDGSVIECSADVEPEVFHAARVGLGALGVISTVTLRCPPAFNLHAIEPSVDNPGLLTISSPPMTMIFSPHTDWALTKRNNRTDRPLSPRTLAGVPGRHPGQQCRLRSALPGGPSTAFTDPTPAREAFASRRRRLRGRELQGVRLPAAGALL
jgi:L-gulonolactone oxidase